MKLALGILVLSAALPVGAIAQSPEHPLGLDPYKPSDAALLRSHGAVLASQASPEELAALDPYKPSHAALLRMGGALPACVFGWVAPYGPCARSVVERRPVPDEQARMPFSRETARTEPAADEPTAVASVRRPESNDGIWITFRGERWLLSGRAVEYVPSAYEVVGDADGRPVYRRTAARDDRIYIPTSAGYVAPFRRRG